MNNKKQEGTRKKAVSLPIPRRRSHTLRPLRKIQSLNDIPNKKKIGRLITINRRNLVRKLSSRKFRKDLDNIRKQIAEIVDDPGYIADLKDELKSVKFQKGKDHLERVSNTLQQFLEILEENKAIREETETDYVRYKIM